MKEISFVPDYGFRGRLEKAMAFIVMPIYLIIGFVLLINYGDWTSLLNGQGLLSILYDVGIPVLFILFICHQRPKEIALSPSQVIIRKYIFPEQILRLHELTAMDNEEVRFGRRKIDLKVMKNGKDLPVIIKTLIDEGKTQRGQVLEASADQRSQTEQTLNYSIAFAIFSLIAWYFIPAIQRLVGAQLLAGIVFVVTYSGISLFLKYKHK